MKIEIMVNGDDGALFPLTVYPIFQSRLRVLTSKQFLRREEAAFSRLFVMSYE